MAGQLTKGQMLKRKGQSRPVSSSQEGTRDVMVVVRGVRAVVVTPLAGGGACVVDWWIFVT